MNLFGRRNFLGSIIGTVVATGLPFVAKRSEFRICSSRHEQAKRHMRAFDLNESQLSRFTMAVFTKECSNVPVLIGENPEILSEDLGDRLHIKFTYPAILLTAAITATRACLIDDEGYVVNTHAYSEHFISGDTLVMHKHINLDFSNMDNDALIRNS